MLLLSVNGFDGVLLNEAVKRSHVEPQRSTLTQGTSLNLAFL
jgi:hypothetical protein